jgi:hypothetical protein
MKNRKFYGAYNHMGLDYNWNVDTWQTYQFDTKAERDAWVSNDTMTGRGALSRQIITRKEAEKIIACKIEDLRVMEDRGIDNAVRLIKGYR